MRRKDTVWKYVQKMPTMAPPFISSDHSGSPWEQTVWKSRDALYKLRETVKNVLAEFVR